MLQLALYRRPARSSGADIVPGRIMAVLPQTSVHIEDGAQIVMSLVHGAEIADPERWVREGAVDRLDLFQIPRAAGRWAHGYERWFAQVTADIPAEQIAPTAEGGSAYPFLCEAGRISRESIPEAVQRQHLAYVGGRARNLLLGGWLVRQQAFGRGAPLPDVRGVFVYAASDFAEADRMGWSDPTAVARYWTPLSFEPCLQPACH